MPFSRFVSWLGALGCFALCLMFGVSYLSEFATAGSARNFGPFMVGAGLIITLHWLASLINSGDQIGKNHENDENQEK